MEFGFQPMGLSANTFGGRDLAAKTRPRPDRKSAIGKEK